MSACCSQKERSRWSPVGSRGIGSAIAQDLAAEGRATVIVNYVRGEVAAARTVRAITEAGGRAHGLRADVGDESSVRGDVPRDPVGLRPAGRARSRRPPSRSTAWSPGCRWPTSTRCCGSTPPVPCPCCREAARMMIPGRPGRPWSRCRPPPPRARPGAANYAASKRRDPLLFTRGLAAELSPTGFGRTWSRPVSSAPAWPARSASGGTPDAARPDRPRPARPPGRGGPGGVVPGLRPRVVRHRRRSSTSMARLSLPVRLPPGHRTGHRPLGGAVGCRPPSG